LPPRGVLMPTVISDPPQTIYLVLLAAVIVSALVWLNRREKRSLYAFFGVLAVTALVVLLDRLIESQREEAVRRVQAMMTAADRRDHESFASHLADTVKYQGEQGEITFTRDQLRRHSFWTLLGQFNVHVAAWDFSRDDVRWPDANSVEIGFLAKGELRGDGGKQFPFYFRATFARQADGQMKLARLASFDPLNREKRLSIPGL
jgi:hypothetical protein